MHLGQGSGSQCLMLDLKLIQAHTETGAQRGLNLSPGQRFGGSIQLLQGIRQRTGQKVLPQQCEHLADLHIGALQPPQLGDKPAGLAAQELGVAGFRLRITARAQARQRAVKGEGAAGSQSRQRHCQAATHASAAN